MKDANLHTTIHEVCSESPKAEALACLLHEKLSELARRSPNTFISYNLLFDITRKNIKNDFNYDKSDLYSAIQVLCSPKINFLKLNYQFIDDHYDPINLSLADVIDANESNLLEHPYTGELVRDYKKYVFPFFTVCNIKRVPE
ncbi:hypothetical protein [Pantoea sp. SOD02]|uniref:hypothetical protein n=1 Tax=Pantoea sp. SOD02 TaxID=2970818 RepID=UPI0021583E06|nr:hypothetical protein [Pantoea sp. SOD02]UVC28833.1 hypothetical protein NR302_16575 [Pantoea sp. SOD02]